MKLAPLALALVALPAFAADGDGIPQGTGAPGSGILVPMPALTRGMTLGPGTGGAAASFTRNPFNFPAPGGATASATMSGGITAAGAARALAVGLARGAIAGGIAGVAMTGAALLWDAYRIKPDEAGGLTQDPGQPKVNTPTYCWDFGSGNCYGSPEAAAMGRVNQLWPYTGTASCGPVQPNFTAQCNLTWSNGATGSIGVSRSSTMQLKCPDINGQTQTAGADGLCPSTAPRVPVTPEQAQAKLAANPPATPPNYPALLTEAIDDWGPLSMRPEDIHNNQLNVISTPNSYAGPVTTATDILSGDTTTTETHYDFSGLTPTSMTYDPSRMSLTFAGSGAGFAGANSLGSTIPAAKAEWATRTVTTKRDAQGNITSQTTTTTASGSGSNTTTGEDAPVTDCGANPNRAGCLELGDAPLDAVVPAQHALTWAAVNLGLPAACPAPYTFNWRGASYAMPYTAFCDVAPNVRALLLAFTSVIVAAFVLSSIK
jgi:hypothetical protein